MFENYIKTYKRNFLSFEFLLSILYSGCIIILMNLFYDQSTILNWIKTSKSEIYPLIATIGGTLLGFVITGVSIIMAFSESEKLKPLRESKQYKTLFEVYFSTIKFLAITTILGIIGVIINAEYSIIIFYLTIWSVIISFFRLWRCMWILENIVEIFSIKKE